MKKIPTLLKRDPEDRSKVLDEITPGCEWVLAGEGMATRKYDGTCVKKDETGMWWARREVKKGKLEPEGFVLEDYDDITGNKYGWVLIDESPFHKFWQEATRDADTAFASGTYELCGPKINGNPEKMTTHTLIKHGEYAWNLPYPTTIEDIKNFIKFLGDSGSEGIVWHHPDGRMAKLKYKDIKEN